MLWSNQTQSARMAVVYITAGTLIDVWTAVYYFLILRPESARNPNGGSDSSLFWVAGFFLTGLALLIIGLLVGRIGQAAGKAEVAPTAAVPVAAEPRAVIQAPVAAAPIINDPRLPNVVAPVQHVAPVA